MASLGLSVLPPRHSVDPEVLDAPLPVPAMDQLLLCLCHRSVIHINVIDDICMYLMIYKCWISCYSAAVTHRSVEIYFHIHYSREPLVNHADL